MMTKKQAEKACKAHGFSPAAAAQMLKWRAGGAASNAWLEKYVASVPPRPVHNQGDEPWSMNPN